MVRKKTYEELEQRVQELEKEAIQGERAEEFVQQSDRKYRVLAESLNELVCRADPKTLGASYVNTAVERLYGYTVED